MKYVVLAVLALFMCTQIGWSYQPSQEYLSVAVEPGQTVWQLASVAAGDDMDVRQVVNEILEDNGLTGTSDIRAKYCACPSHRAGPNRCGRR